MSYRKHLSIINKNRYNNFLKKYPTGYDKDDCSLWYLPRIAKTNIEIYKAVDIKNFKKVKLKESIEYHPRILNKKDLNSILEFYKTVLLDNITSDIVKINKFKAEYNEIIKNGNSKEDLINDLLWFISGYENTCHQIKWYFESLEKNTKKNIIDSDYFLLQYFYLSRLYESFDWKKDVLVLTHG